MRSAQRGEVMPVVLYLRAFRYGKTNTRKDVYHFVFDDRDGMA
jgi:hypothetical protein